MRKLLLSIITVMSLAGISLAGNCNDHQQVTMADSNPVLLFQIGDMELMKYTNNGIVLYRVKKYSGEAVAEDLDREQLAALFPEMLKIWKVKTL